MTRDEQVQIAELNTKITQLTDYIKTDVAPFIKKTTEEVITHRERIAVLDRNVRTIYWIGGISLATFIGAFLTHIFIG